MNHPDFFFYFSQFRLIKSNLQYLYNNIIHFAMLNENGKHNYEIDSALQFATCKDVEKKVYDFSMKDILENGTVSLSNHQKNVMLIVNVATY